jgi:altronate dehydratase large subunit
MNFLGYLMPDGKVGVRNHVILLPTTVCANVVADHIARKVEGTISLLHPHGCGELPHDAGQTARTLAGMGKNPNVAAVLVIGVGCELLSADAIASRIESPGKRVEIIVIQKIGGTLKAIKEGVRIARKMVKDASGLRRKRLGLDALILGVECGGSDSFSGLSANPALGIASDLLIEEGGTVILSETPEMIGAEHILARRAINGRLSRKVLEMARRTEKLALHYGYNIAKANPSPGNIEGGITTLEEKSLGCILKGGTTKITEVLEFAQAPTKKGLVLMDTPGHDPESVTGLAAGGAQIIAYTTGRGTPLGSAVTPVIKISSNSTVCSRMRDNIDLNAGQIITANRSVREIGERIFREVVRVASGKLTKSEILGHREFAINRIGPSF